MQLVHIVSSSQPVAPLLACMPPLPFPPQELLLMLDEYWSRHPELRHVPIFQCSGLATKALSVFQTYMQSMNKDIQDCFMAVSGSATEEEEEMKCTKLSSANNYYGRFQVDYAGQS
jgi:hypothetical protein